MRGYHIRIILHPNPPLSASNSSFPNTDTFIPTSIFEHLPAQLPKHTARRNALFNSKHKDYRYGPIRLDWVDFDNMSTAAVNGKEKEHGRGTQSHFIYQISSNDQPGTAMATFLPNTRTKS